MPDLATKCLQIPFTTTTTTTTNYYYYCYYYYFLLKVLHSQGTWKLAKCSVCVRNVYDGDSEIVIIIIIIIIIKQYTMVFVGRRLSG